MSDPKSRKHFSLTELLIVLAAIVILISLLMPAMSNALLRAKVLECTNNKKQLAHVNRMYNDDFSDWYVPGKAFNPLWSNGTAFVITLNELYEYTDPKNYQAFAGNRRVRRGGILDCPLFVVPAPGVNAFECATADTAGASHDIAFSGGLHGMYGMDGFSRQSHDWDGGQYVSLKPTDNPAVRENWTIRRASQVSHPAKVPQITDGFGCGELFNKMWRAMETAEHGTSGEFSRVIIWADMHASVEEPGFEYENF